VNDSSNQTPPTISTQRQTGLLQSLADLIKHRSVTEIEIEADYKRNVAECNAQHAAAAEELSKTHEEETDSLNAKYLSRLETARLSFESNSARTHEQREASLELAQAKHREAIDAADLALRQALDLAEANFDQDTQLAESVALQAKTTADNTAEQFVWLESQGQKLLKRRGTQFTTPASQAMGEHAAAAALLGEYGESAKQAHERIQELSRWKSVKYCDEGWPVIVFFVVLGLGGVATGLQLGWGSWQWIVRNLVGAAVVSLGTWGLLEAFVRRQAASLIDEIKESLGLASLKLNNAQSMVSIEHKERERQLEARRAKQESQARTTYETTKADLDSQLENHSNLVVQKAVEQLSTLQTTWDAEADGFRKKFPPMIQEKQQAFEQLTKRMVDERDAKLERFAKEYNERWDSLIESWKQGVTGTFRDVDEMNQFCDAKFPAWDAVDWNSWQPTNEDLPALRIGNYSADLTGFEGGLSERDRLKIDRTELELPAVLSFPGSPSLLLEAQNEGRDAAVGVIQNAMLRMLTSLPAGKVRFTIIDPTGLGQNFSAFMHLADYDDRLISNRIWTETQHINQRLADLTEHMENVIQKYLRNEFDSIQQYNEQAGEVAEPFQVLVVANFPANFSEDAARRLVSISSSGARCGVYTLISADTKMKPPRNFDLADIEANSNTLVWADGKLQWKRPELARFPVTLESPPSDERVTEIICAAGRHAKDANRVEVPFASVVPDRSQWWTHDSRSEVQVPLGRAGATQLQNLHLGKGTSQHVLIAGKTGSGKSTFMHALVTNMAIHYAPTELQFYLVDFKKGVEFKTYAQFGLPHARVIAIESEREFGLSVLQRLDQELQQRGDKFRSAGVQSLAGYRDAHPDAVMPRLVLLVDEFQEFFVKDDKIAQDSSLLLDRLVRQGRAFGIHVVLGSQTLAGAYTLARSTIGQMAVRIALQCSEADAHLILSEENTAARLLSRPGEAIYNNANGLFEGNHPFQIVWLPDAEREDYLQQLETMARDQGVTTTPPIVFEGNVAADLSKNRLLNDLLEEPPAADKLPIAKAWLGSAIAIKDPTDIVLRRQSGNHLLIAGQDEQMAAGILTSCVIGLAAAHPQRNGSLAPGAKFHVLDGGGFESLDFDFGARLKRKLTLDIHSVENADVATVIDQLATEVTRRIDERDASGESQFLVVYNLARFRQLRKSEDDYGMSGFGEEESKDPGKQFAHIIKEGPNVGIHVLMWCDTFNNVTRWLDRTTLRDVAWRVLFQMSATDSSNLMDSAAASQLGMHRAIVYSDERGEFEKFRPYGVPSDEFFGQVSDVFQR
jgi:energy-coupling factor transporter ATP-binding protein EcfA2